VHKFPAENWQRLESDERRKLIPPEPTLRRFGLRDGMTFVDIGAGTGFFSREAARIVGEGGKIIAAEMSETMIDQMKSIGVPTNAQVIRSEEYAIPIEDSISDMTWIAFVTHETPDVPRFIREATRITKKGGKIVIVDWKKQEEEYGPSKEERLSQEMLRTQLGAFSIKGEGSLNPSHYFVEIEVTKP
jgi:ubiquinone/menaquinone biosynthesis C-methylase UbiE